MAHVEIKFKSNGTGFVSVDGVQVPALADGFEVEFPPELGRQPVVRMQVPAETLEIDLPVAVVEALRDEPEPRGEPDGLDAVIAANIADLAGLKATVERLVAQIAKATKHGQQGRA